MNFLQIYEPICLHKLMLCIWKRRVKVGNEVKTFKWLVCMLWQVNGCWDMYIFVFEIFWMLRLKWKGLILDCYFSFESVSVVWISLFGLGPLLILNVVSRPTAVSEDVLPNKGNNRMNVFCFCHSSGCEDNLLANNYMGIFKIPLFLMFLQTTFFASYSQTSFRNGNLPNLVII